MNYKHLTYLLLTSPLLLHAATPSSQSQGKPRPSQNQVNTCESAHDLNRISIRHIESKGIGYNKGYTTLEGFFVPLSSLNNRWVPFLDLRGHIFNDGKPAANGGIGLRYIDSRVWGGNVYYDYRKTSERNYNQVSFGFESLGRYLDYRINGYFPVGKDKGSYSDAKFDYFSGHSLYISRKRELALKGTNAEVGVHIAKVKGIDFYSALGPYYFTNSSKQTFGGEFRIGMDVLNILRIEGNTSYDHLFKWIGQGQISLSYAFTPKKISRKEKKGSCSFHGFVRDRAFQRVDKQEIVVITTQKKTSVAVDPATGLPYVFWFVDNTSNSQGTYESPYSTLANAQTNSRTNDIIAVLPGDGTDRGMNNGITLKDGQKLWGMSIAHKIPTTLGNITVKPLASTMPLLTNISGNVITGANSNDIVGLKILAPGTGIFISSKSGNYNIRNNVIIVSDDGNGIVTTGSGTGNISIVGNTFIAGDSSDIFGIYRFNGGLSNYLISNNIFTSANPNSGWSRGIDLSQSGSAFQAYITRNNFNSQTNSTINTAAISVGVSGSDNFPSKFLITDNIVNISAGMSNPLAGIRANTNSSSTSILSGTLRHNQVTTYNPITPAYLLQNTSTSASQLDINFASDNLGKAVLP
ncbi:MAG: inverse autotransporter beta domain-containing protein [Rhabdochlamydiaceae bacterium]|jgi:hypothetical protein